MPPFDLNQFIDPKFNEIVLEDTQLEHIEFENCQFKQCNSMIDIFVIDKPD